MVYRQFRAGQFSSDKSAPTVQRMTIQLKYNSAHDNSAQAKFRTVAIQIMETNAGNNGFVVKRIYYIIGLSECYGEIILLVADVESCKSAGFVIPLIFFFFFPHS